MGAGTEGEVSGGVASQVEGVGVTVLVGVAIGFGEVELDEFAVFDAALDEGWSGVAEEFVDGAGFIEVIELIAVFK